MEKDEKNKTVKPKSKTGNAAKKSSVGDSTKPKSTKKTSSTSKSSKSSVPTDEKLGDKTSPKAVKSSSANKSKSSQHKTNTSVDSLREQSGSNESVENAKESVIPKKTSVPKKKKPEKRMTEEIEDVLRKDKNEPIQEIKEIKKRGRVFYLVFSIIFYGGAYFYINTVLYNNQDHLQSALFAFAALFVMFVLLQFNIHMIFINFFRLPLRFLLNEAKLEMALSSEISEKQSKSKFPFAKYKAIFNLVLYLLISLLLVGSQIYNGILDGDKVLVIITQSALTLLIFLFIVCSWQYLFNILPRVLDKSIDAKNGFILTLSAAVMVIYVVFIIFDIVYLAEMMIFVLIVGFIALLGVNLNMIVGEINIFQNLKTRHSKTVSRVVFLIFFSFHLYVILYASVVAYSIYNWQPDSYNFAYPVTESVLIRPVYNDLDIPIDEVFNGVGDPIINVYDRMGNPITDFYTDENEIVYPVFDSTGVEISQFFDSSGQMIFEVYDSNGDVYYNFRYFDGTLAATKDVPKTYTYDDFLYYTVVTVSTLGYGDISPSTEYNIAQAWGAFLSIYGFTFFALSISFVSNIAMEGTSMNREDDTNE
ncbi:MAG: two pore domain potassium channel family protein [Bacilli bacterium]|nr:two pore domain potassium channel family protein [Bacilli bacterium]